LNDLYFFAQVVIHNGFTGAARALGVDRSSISRRISQLEKRLGVRLIQRTTRRFVVTDFGMEFHGHCMKLVAEANAAYERVACVRAVPSGMINLCCPPMIAQLWLGSLIPAFIAKNPQVRIAMEATHRQPDAQDNFDLFIRVQQSPSEDSGLIARPIGVVQHVLVANRKLLARRHRWPESPAELTRSPTLSYGALQGPHTWKLIDRDEGEIQIRHDPVLISDDLVVIRQAAAAGLGIARLPLSTCLEEIRHGTLEILLPDFVAPLCEVQVVYSSRRGLLPSVRSFIDYLIDHRVGESGGNRPLTKRGKRGGRSATTRVRAQAFISHPLAAAPPGTGEPS